MPEITVRRRFGPLIQGVLRILQSEPDGLHVREVIARLEREVPPTDFERQDYPSRPGVRRYDQTIRFATIRPVKAGWIMKSRGYWRITPEGAQALQRFSDPEDLDRESHRLYRQWASTCGQGGENGLATEPESGLPSEIEGTEATASLALEDAEAQAWEQIERYVGAIDPYEAQRLVAGLLKGMGYHVAWVAPPGPDQGFDILAHTDPLGAGEPTLKVAVRRRQERADIRDLREFAALLHPSEVGIFVSFSGFTRPALEWARQEQRRLRCIDLERFFDLWVEHYPRIPEQERRLLPIRAVWFLDLEPRN